MVTLNSIAYKMTLYLIKIIPMCISLCDMLNTVLWLIGIDFGILSYIGGISFLTIILLYLLSIVFKFCFYHRMFIHYVTLNNIISIFDYYHIIPVNKIIYIVLLGVVLFYILYYHVKKLKKKKI